MTLTLARFANSKVAAKQAEPVLAAAFDRRTGEMLLNLGTPWIQNFESNGEHMEQCAESEHSKIGRCCPS
jgi:hypothetical protein